MPVEVSEDRVIIRFEIDEALELSDLTGSLTALESQYQRVLAIRGIDKKDINAKLYVTRLGSNSIEAEVAFWWLIARDVISAMDYTNIATDFTERLRRVIDRFSGKKLEGEKTKVPEINKDDLDDFEKFLKPIAGKKRAGLTIRRAKFQSKSGDREVLAEYDFGAQDLSNALMNIGAERDQLEGKVKPKHHIEKNVLLVWHQTNKEEGKVGGRTADRAVISKISETPLPVFFATDHSTIKHKMTRIKANPLYTGFMVDVDVQYVGEEPKVYTVMELHQRIDLEPPEES